MPNLDQSKLVGRLAQVPDQLKHCFTRGCIRRYVSENPQVVAPFALVASIALLLLFGQAEAAFNADALSFLLRNSIPLSILGLGVGLVVAMGEIDLSFVGVSAATSLLILSLFGYFGVENHFSTSSIVISSLLSVGIGGIFGLANGILIARFRAPSLILTWGVGGTLSLAVLVIAFLMTHGHITIPGLKASIENIQSIAGNPLRAPEGRSLFQEPGALKGLFLGGALLVFVIWTVRSFGLDLYARAIGANALNAKSQGLPVPLIQKMCFAFSGSCAGLAGYYSSVIQTGNISTTGYFERELIVIAIVVLGGASLRGGFYNVFAIVCACFFWTLCSYVARYLPLATGTDFAALTSSLLQGCLAVILVGISILAGKTLAADTYSVNITAIKQEEDHDK